MIVYQSTPQQTAGGQSRMVVRDDNADNLLTHILLELRKMNKHLEDMTDKEVNESDLDMGTL